MSIYSLGFVHELNSKLSVASISNEKLLADINVLGNTMTTLEAVSN